MKKLPLLAAFAALALSATADSTVQAVLPFTYLGRVMDAQHLGFDTNHTATLRAYDASGTLLAQSATKFFPSSRNNYVLDIPLASPAIEGYAEVGAVLTVSVVADGVTWAGIVVDADRSSGTVVGKPGGVKVMDIVLANDKDGDGIDDDLLESLRAQWESSDYWKEGEEFDPKKDYDGDGVSTIDEALTGTDPFDSDDSLRIISYKPSAGDEAAPHEIAFPTVPSHVYALQKATSLSSNNWETISFLTAPDSSTPVNVLTRSSSGGAQTPTVYLLPADEKSAFFRVKAE